MEADAKTKYWAAAGTDVIPRALSSRSPSGIQPRACGDPFREWAAGLCKAFAGVLLGTNPLESLSSLVLELVRPFKDTETSIDAHLVGQESDLFDVSLGERTGRCRSGSVALYGLRPCLRWKTKSRMSAEASMIVTAGSGTTVRPSGWLSGEFTTT
jgi:hypothetical protein